MENRNILVVDDNKDFLHELGETLQMSGYNMITADDPVVALKLVNEIKVDLILLDLLMPGKNGFELAYEIKRIPSLQNVPIIAMTGYFNENYSFIFETCGIRALLKKPFNPLDVISEIEAALV